MLTGACLPYTPLENLFVLLSEKIKYSKPLTVIGEIFLHLILDKKCITWIKAYFVS